MPKEDCIYYMHFFIFSSFTIDECCIFVFGKTLTYALISQISYQILIFWFNEKFPHSIAQLLGKTLQMFLHIGKEVGQNKYILIMN
jgi:hypothetical protein